MSEPPVPRHQPPWQLPPEPAEPSHPSGAYLVTKPGGLSGTAHAVHILICLLTCGLWIPGYILFIIFAPAQRQEVITPYGQPVPHIAGIPRPVPPYVNPPQTPEQVRASNRRIAL